MVACSTAGAGGATVQVMEQGGEDGTTPMAIWLGLIGDLRSQQMSETANNICSIMTV